MAGIMQAKYHQDRLRRVDVRYRLNRRLREIRHLIEKHSDNPSCLRCLEVGTAEGLLLSGLHKAFRFKEAVGIDLSEDLIKKNTDSDISLELGDAERLKFDDKSFDIIIAAAVIEHLDNPRTMLAECHRVLKPAGILIATIPNPFHDTIASLIGYFDDEIHVDKLSLKKLRFLFENAGFTVIESYNFMFFPFCKVPGELLIDATLRFLRLGRLMSNQLIIGRK